MGRVRLPFFSFFFFFLFVSGRGRSFDDGERRLQDRPLRSTGPNSFGLKFKFPFNSLLVEVQVTTESTR